MASFILGVIVGFVLVLIIVRTAFKKLEKNFPIEFHRFAEAWHRLELLVENRSKVKK